MEKLAFVAVMGVYLSDEVTCGRVCIVPHNPVILKSTEHCATLRLYVHACKLLIFLLLFASVNFCCLIWAQI